ncbi:ATP-binding protein [Corynebacterium gallinarum]|uniref:Putative DNA binding domain-containing protein n=1 Tax=Corynebacterium gallinarum TaxID=2762214 RepID=A0A8I0LF21_9CORY|nr:ATP-binding protein [Corynebacterium gallinarum]MBD8029328.1 putative DNA binding domain-containing protein [Corynebacterium gallinarum]
MKDLSTDSLNKTTDELVKEIRRKQSELPDVELKESRTKLSKNLVETISAFANTKGGVILLGLSDPAKGALPVEGFSPEKARDSMESLLQKLQQIPKTQIDIEVIDEQRILRVDIKELENDLKPCFIQERGMYSGSYTRTGEGERKLTHYEIDRLLENRSVPDHDQQAVDGATLDDLDKHILQKLVDQQKATKPRAYGDSSDIEILNSLSVVKKDPTEGIYVTLAGLLATGLDPQRFYPRLRVTYVEYPTNEPGANGPDGERFIVNESVEGSIPEIVAQTLTIMRRYMSKKTYIQDGKRIDKYPYPLTVIRELLVNALMHRDYSPAGCLNQVQIEVFPNRITISNPGGLHGSINEEDLGAEYVSSSRNPVLSRLLEFVELPQGGAVAENRGSGIRTVFKELSDAGMNPPAFKSSLKQMLVTITPDSLLDPETVEWIESCGLSDLTSQQMQAIATAYKGNRVTNATLQSWGLHQADATKELTKLVESGIFLKEGDRRGASYVLNEAYEPPASTGLGISDLSPAGESVYTYLMGETDSKSARDIAAATGYEIRTVQKHLSTLLRSGAIERLGKPRSPHLKYRKVGSQDSANPSH